ncbi:hypothetical protein IAR55_000749 [Kwoniella newhampshirensis]|uniref:HD/PDEase domain-containing protein n=1 Tax=Kwoniella newhampshirensis TaxID=1651941 RepID=A0AAW0Z3V2_9TREE
MAYVRPTELLGQAEALVRREMAKYDPSHDWPHVDRVRKMALKIAQTMTPTPDLLVVELAALFHDLNGKYITSSSPSLSTLLSPLLSLSPVTSDQSALVLGIIPSISYTSELRLSSSVPSQWTWQSSCPELHAVQDADRLDAIGSIGIMRVSAYSGAKGRKLLEDEEMVKIGESAEGHFEEKLLKVRDRMKTVWGREEAEKRHQTMVHFLSDLERERESAL